MLHYWARGRLWALKRSPISDCGFFGEALASLTLIDTKKSLNTLAASSALEGRRHDTCQRFCLFIGHCRRLLKDGSAFLLWSLSETVLYFEDLIAI